LIWDAGVRFRVLGVPNLGSIFNGKLNIEQGIQNEEALADF
jgi:hypothetical protein